MVHEARRGANRMIDNFALALSHGLLLLAAWRLLSRADLDDDSAPAPDPDAPPQPFLKLRNRKGA
jgi:hypothetical protein